MCWIHILTSCRGGDGETVVDMMRRYRFFCRPSTEPPLQKSRKERKKRKRSLLKSKKCLLSGVRFPSSCEFSCIQAEEDTRPPYPPLFQTTRKYLIAKVGEVLERARSSRGRPKQRRQRAPKKGRKSAAKERGGLGVGRNAPGASDSDLEEEEEDDGNGDSRDNKSQSMEEAGLCTIQLALSIFPFQSGGLPSPTSFQLAQTILDQHPSVVLRQQVLQGLSFTILF